MYNYVFRKFGNGNPAGIVINFGWYALAECIITGKSASETLLTWCGLRYDTTEKPRNYPKNRIYVPPNEETNKAVIEIYRANPHLKNCEIAKIVNRSDTFVSNVLRKIGVKRDRWERHVSTYPRYAKTGGKK